MKRSFRNSVQCELTMLLLIGAVADFTIAVEQAPYFADGWKRRGQARSALDYNAEALDVPHVFCQPCCFACGTLFAHGCMSAYLGGNQRHAHT